MIKELNKYSEEFKRYRANNTLPQGDIKNALADIYEANWQNNKRWGVSKVTRSCPSCIGDMMKCLAAEWESGLNHFKGVPQEIEAEEDTDIDLSNNPSEMIEEDYHNWYEEVEALKWGAFKRYCTGKGISVKGKTRKQLMEELNGVH